VGDVDHGLRGGGERPEDALLDPPLLITGFLWLATASAILFLVR
jgi:hypothetical protein